MIVGSGGPGGAFVGTPGHLQSLNSLIPAAAGVTITDPVGINDNGQIVANGSDSTSGNIAFLLTPS